MKPCRLHIVGASGSGTSTLGRAVAGAWSVPFHDSDDYFWQPTEPPYTLRREVAERLDLVARMFLPRKAWVLSGSVMGWGEPFAASFDLVVFLQVDPAVRLARLRQREASRIGAAAIAPGGALHQSHVDFMAWAAGYDDPAFTGRSLRRHEAWLAALGVPVLRLDGDRPTGDLVAEIAAVLPGP